MFKNIITIKYLITAFTGIFASLTIAVPALAASAPAPAAGYVSLTLPKSVTPSNEYCSPGLCVSVDSEITNTGTQVANCTYKMDDSPIFVGPINPGSGLDIGNTLNYSKNLKQLTFTLSCDDGTNVKKVVKVTPPPPVHH